MLIKTPLLHQSFGPRVFLSLSISLSLFLADSLERESQLPLTQEILASFLLSLSHRRLRTTRFRSIKGPTHQQYPIVPFFSTALLTHVISFLFDNSHSNRCELIADCSFDLLFLDLTVLSIFSGTWSFVCFLWRNVYSNPLSTFWLGCLFCY